MEKRERRCRDRTRVGVKAEGGIMLEFSPWRHTGSPKIRGVINLSMEPANPTAPRPGNLASSGGGRAAGGRRDTDRRDREDGVRDAGKE